MTAVAQQELFGSVESAGARFDPARRYRYRLWRRWAKGPALLWIMLNPSTADERVLDPTLRRCIDYTRRWGFPAMEIGNLYAFRATKPKDLWTVDDPVGPENFEVLEALVCSAAKVIVGWGGNAKPDVLEQISTLFEEHRVRPFCVGKSEDTGQPYHPLYQPKDAELIPWP